MFTQIVRKTAYFHTLLAVVVSLIVVKPALSSLLTVTDIGPASAVCCLNAGGEVLYNEPVNTVTNTWIYSNGVATDLGLLEAGRSGATPLAINNAGNILVTGQLGVPAEFSTSGGQATQILGAWPSSFTPRGLNNTGGFAGATLVFTPTGAANQAAIVIGGQLTVIPALSGSVSSAAGAINDAGMVAGSATLNTPSQPIHGFLYANGQTTDIGSLGNNTWLDTSPAAINVRGEIVGYSAPTFSTMLGGQEAFTYFNGQMTGLGTLGGSYSEAQGVNDQGEVVGFSALAGSSQETAFLWANGAMIDLNSLLPQGFAYDLTDALGINDADQIAAIGYDPLTGDQQAFLLQLGSSPAAIPEPDTWVLLGLGAIPGLVGLRKRRR